MIVINSIEKGIVIDHITAGFGIKVLHYLNIDQTTDMVAFIMNAPSKKHGRKDVIKFTNLHNVDLTALGLIDHTATVNIIQDHKIVKKIKLELPEKVTNVIKCKNPRCVTSVEPNAPHVFHLLDENHKEYSCEYCDDIVKLGV